MSVDDELVATARQLLGESSRWSVRTERRGTKILLHAAHPASHGFTLEIEESDPDRAASLLAWMPQQREVSVANAAPTLEHQVLVLGLQTVASAFEWPTAEVRAVSFLLFEAGALTLDEAAWLAGYIAEDAPMEPVSPLGP